MAIKKSNSLSPPAFFKRVAQQSTARDYKHKEMVFEQGAKADAMYYLRSGNVERVVEAKNGKKAVLAILRKGDFFGEGCLGREPLRLFSAMAIQPSTLRESEGQQSFVLFNKSRHSRSCSSHTSLNVLAEWGRECRRPDLQLQRETPGQDPAAFGELRNRIQTKPRIHQDQPGNPR